MKSFVGCRSECAPDDLGRESDVAIFNFLSEDAPQERFDSLWLHAPHDADADMELSRLPTRYRLRPDSSEENACVLGQEADAFFELLGEF